jgi:hypothetical protein
LNASASVVGGVTQVVLTFDSADTEYGSLRTGNFTLTVLGNQVFNDGGLLDGDGDGTSGGDSVTSLYRLYGDVTGDRAVNGADFALFRTAFGTATGDSSYNAAFDFNGDGVINGADFAFFRSNFGSVLNP